MVDHSDSFLLSQPSVIDKRSRSTLPFMKERMRLSESLVRILIALGVAPADDGHNELERLVLRELGQRRGPGKNTRV